MSLTPWDVARATTIAIGAAHPSPVETVPLADAADRIAASDIAAPLALPRFSASAMDGYAVRAVDTVATADHPVRLRLVGESRAGCPAEVAVEPGEATRISTGAPLPAGADAVVRLEEATEGPGERVTIVAPVSTGRDIRAAGEDVSAGEPAIAAGDLLHPGRLALLGGLGVTAVAVRRPPTVTVVVTGDEVRGGGGRLAAGEVHDVCGVLLPALLRAAGAVTVELLRVPDDRAATIEAFAAATGDLIVSSGGVSVGRHDHVRPALAALDATEALFGVDVHPGRPVWIGHAPLGGRSRVVVGLPGNPASACVTACLFAVPALQAIGGAAPAAPAAGRLAVDFVPDARRARALLVRAAITDDGALTVLPRGPRHYAHRLRPLADGDAIAIVSARDAALPAGTPVPVVPIPGIPSPW